MNRGVWVSVWLLLACDGEGAAPRPPPGTGRVQAVAAKQVGAEEFAGFCDVHAAPGRGEPLRLPAAEPAPADAAGKPRWVNLWATWCKPCVEEMPMIARWREELRAQGIAPAIDFVAVDENPETVRAFLEQHPGMPRTLRLSSADALAPFMDELGLDSGAGLPIHVFAGPDHKLRCVRAGAVTPSHYEMVAALLR